jgi:DNA-binding CsgD family transcriptional regulator
VINCQYIQLAFSHGSSQGRKVGGMVSAFNRRISRVAEPVGRTREQRLLSTTFASVCEGNTELVLIGGEAGIGKTTLVEHFLASCRSPDVLLLTSACYDVAVASPYSLWRDVFDHLLGSDWYSHPEQAIFADQTALFRDIQGRLESAAAEQPVIVVLEDAHWSDKESLELLHHISLRVRDIPLLIIVTYRGDEITAGEPFYEALLPLVRECGAERIELARLGRHDIEHLVRTRYDLISADVDRIVDSLASRTGGNPLFAVELLRSMEMAGMLRFENGCWHLSEMIGREIPLLVRQLIERRLRQLDPAVRAVLQTAAILGFEVRPEVLIQVTEDPEVRVSDCLQQAIEAFLLEESPGRPYLRFRHALVQEALYASAPILWRQARHRRIGEVLATMPDVDPAIVAEHFQYGDDRRATIWALESARRARRLFAPNAVIQQLTPVLDRPELLEPDQRVEAFDLRGWANEMTGAFHEANSDYHAALRTALEVGNRYAEREALVRLAELWTYRDYQRVEEYVGQALRVTADLNDQSLLVHSHNRFGTWYMSQDDPAQALSHHERALGISSQSENNAGIAESSDLLGLALALSGDLRGAEEYLHRARAQFDALNDQRGLANSLANIAHIGPTYLADMAVPARTLDECIRTSQQSLEVAKIIAYRSGEAYARVRLIPALGARGLYGSTLEIVQQTLSLAEEIENQQLLGAAHAMAGLLWLDLLEYDRAVAHAEQAREIAERIGSTFRLRMGIAILSLSYTAQGALARAESVLSEIDDDHSARTLAQYLIWRARIELAIGRDDHTGALRLVDALLAEIPHAQSGRPALRTSYLRGQVLNGIGHHDEAETWLLAAQEAATQFGADSLRWRIQRELGITYLGSGDRSRAKRELDEARDCVRLLSESLDDHELRNGFLSSAMNQIPEPIGPTPLQAAKQAFGGLTRRQRQVATLIAAGQTNRAIAEVLSISERTVESHVSAILATLELESRAQIAVWCLEHGLNEDTI